MPAFDRQQASCHDRIVPEKALSPDSGALSLNVMGTALLIEIPDVCRLVSLSK
jgi:hypothetical protein